MMHMEGVEAYLDGLLRLLLLLWDVSMLEVDRIKKKRVEEGL